MGAFRIKCPCVIYGFDGAASMLVPEGRVSVQNELQSRVLKFAWEQDPDLALQAGHIPPSLWRNASERGRQLARETAEGLLDEIAQAHGTKHLAAHYHVASAGMLAQSPSIGVLNHMTGPAASLSWGVYSWPLAADPFCEAYIERLHLFPTYCSALLEHIRDGPASREHASGAVLRAFIAQVDAFVDAHRSSSSALLLPLKRAQAKGQRCKVPSPELCEDVIASLLRLKDAARIALGAAQPASPLPHASKGADRYSAAIYQGTSLHMTPDEIEGLGYKILRASERRFWQLHESAHAAVDIPKTSSDLFEAFVVTHDTLVAASSRVSYVQPTMECEVVPMPHAHAAVGPPAYYGPSSAVNRRKGSVYVNTAQPVTTHGWEILPLAMHEGVPGHHLQLGLLDENDSLPDLIRLLSVNAFAEGWAVYAETLAPAMDLDISPSGEFGLLAHQRWRAARLIVEVGLHVRGWRISEAAKFMVAQTAQDISAVRREIVRYLAWPGQALGYAVGAAVIDHWVKTRTNSGVELIDSHDELLRLGSIPLSTLMTTIDGDNSLVDIE